MKALNYSIIVINIISMIILCVLTKINLIINKKSRRLFITSAMISIGLNICGFLEIFMTGINGYYVEIHAAIKIIELSLAPYICIVASYILDDKPVAGKTASSILTLHVVYQIVGYFFGWTFSVDINNKVQYEKFFFVYYVVWIIVAAIFCIEVYRIVNMHHYKGKTILPFFLAGVLCEVIFGYNFGNNETEFLVVSFSIFGLYVFYNTIMQQLDGLTMLLNRKEYESSLENIKKKFAIVILDVDNFKEKNDIYGHQYGDKCLKDIADSIIDVYGLYGKCFRIGGDEFAVIVYKNIDKTESLNKEFTSVISDRIKNNSYFPTVSMGYCICDPSVEKVSRAIKKADENMYNSKMNRVFEVHNTNKGMLLGLNDESADLPFENLNVESVKKKILIVEDSKINRELLEAILSDDYDIISAEDGEVGLNELKKNCADLSVVILDVYMPNCNGFTFLEKVLKDPKLSNIPVIVSTASGKADDELRCLELGAVDFVTKPYNASIILGRIRNVIRLSESVSVLSEVEHDKLTHMYSMSGFYHYVDETIINYPNSSFDMICMELCEFDIYNRIFGTDAGDEILKYISAAFRKYFVSSIIARQGNKFFAFSTSDIALIEGSIDGLIESTKDYLKERNIHIKFGVYKNVDKSKTTKEIVKGASLATADAGNDENSIYYYDKKTVDKFINSKMISNKVTEALNKGELEAWFQPKVSVENQSIVSAEALIRWVDKDGKFIPPIDFIPILEKEAIIDQLDEYVFKKTCNYIRDRLNKGKKLVPISVNLSRKTLCKSDMVARYKKIANESGIPFDLVSFELTETVAADDVAKKHIKQLVKAGFTICLDDFGSGYSTLTCLAEYIFKELKLDKSLIDEIGNDKGEKILKNLVSLSRDLGAVVTAEGVETEKQLKFLKSIDCDQIQGFIYSKAVTPAEFDIILENGIKKVKM